MRRNKLPFFHRVLRAMSLICHAFDGFVTPSGKIDFGLLKTAMPKDKTTNAQNKESLEQKLWKAADKLRKNIDAADTVYSLFIKI